MNHVINWVLGIVQFALPERELTQRPAEKVPVDKVVEQTPGYLAQLEGVDQEPATYIEDDTARAARRLLEL